MGPVTEDELRIPDPRTDSLLGHFPWGFGLSVLIVPSFISTDYGFLAVLAVLLVMYGFFLNGMRRTMMRNCVCVHVDTNHIVRRRPLCSFRPERHFARRLVPRHRGAYVESNIRPTQAKSHTDGRLHSGSWSFSLRCSGVNISLKVGTERVDLPHMLGRPSAIWHLKNEVQSALGTAHGRRCAG